MKNILMKRKLKKLTKKVAVATLAVAMFGALMPMGMNADNVNRDGFGISHAQAKTKNLGNRGRHKLYRTKLKAMYKQLQKKGGATKVKYKYMDLNGDGLHEMLMYHNGTGSQSRICTVAGTKVKQLWKERYSGGRFSMFYKSGRLLTYKRIGGGTKTVAYLKISTGTTAPRVVAKSKVK